MDGFSGRKLMKRILVTGSEGFIGKRLCRRLSRMNHNYNLFTLDRIGMGVNHSAIDITSKSLESEIIRISPDIIIHLAGNVSVKFSVENPLADFQANALGTLAVVSSALKTSCSNFLYLTSGGAIYNSSESFPFTEDSPTKPTSPYGLSKLIGEQYLGLLAAEGLNWTSLAVSNCYGSVYEQKQGVIYSMWRDLMDGISPRIYGANVSRDFIYIEDVIDIIVMACEKPSNRRLNVSSGTSVTLTQLLEKIQMIMNTNIQPIILPISPGDVPTSSLDNSNARKSLGWIPKTDLDQGLRFSLTHY